MPRCVKCPRYVCLRMQMGHDTSLEVFIRPDDTTLSVAVPVARLDFTSLCQFRDHFGWIGHPYQHPTCWDEILSNARSLHPKTRTLRSFPLFPTVSISKPLQLYQVLTLHLNTIIPYDRVDSFMCLHRHHGGTRFAIWSVPPNSVSFDRTS